MEKSAEESLASATTPAVDVHMRPVQPKKKKKRKKSDKPEVEMVSISQQATVNITQSLFIGPHCQHALPRLAAFCYAYHT